MVGIYDVSKWSRSHRKPLQCETTAKKLNIHVISDGITRLPILEGEVSHIELPRGDSSLGLTIVGGADTPLRCVVVQEVFPEGLVAMDGRLQPGDQIIEVDGIDMTTATHKQVCDALKKSSSVVKLGVYRERIEAYKSSPASSSSSSSSQPNSYLNYQSNYNEDGMIYEPVYQGCQENSEDSINISLKRHPGRKVGVRLCSRKSEPGVFVSELTKNSVAEQDGRLQQQDRILYINGDDVRYATAERASMLMECTQDFVNLIISRTNSARTRKRFGSISQDSLIGYEDNDLCSANYSTSASDQASDCSVVDEEQIISDKASDDSQASPTTMSSSNIEINMRAHNSFEIPSSDNFPNGELETFQSISEYQDKNSRQNQPRYTRTPNERQYELDTVKSPEVEQFSHMCAWLREKEQMLHQKKVILRKCVSESLGMRIGGGLHSNEGDTPIYVANINHHGPAGKSRQIKKGDVVMAVNNDTLFGLTHAQAVAMLKSTAELSSVILTLLEGPETCSGSANFVPSWLYWQRIPRALHISKGVVLHRTPGTSLGFSIVGGADPQRGSEPIHVLFVVATSPAAIEGRLRCGDRLLAVDGQCLEGVSHATAVYLLKQAAHRVTLEVVSWMGTEL